MEAPSDDVVEFVDPADAKWADIPRPEICEADAVCAIAYEPHFKELMDLFRGYVMSGEVSDRGLELSFSVVDLNPSNYTAWAIRRKILRQLYATDVESLRKELDLTGAIILDENEKNYQVWHHRQAVAMMLPREQYNGGEEFMLTKVVLERDGKNYHAWSHRMWAVEYWQRSDRTYCLSMISMDPLNNSAWSALVRWVTEETFEMDMRLALGYLATESENDSIVAFLTHFLRSGIFTLPTELVETIMELPPSCSSLRLQRELVKDDLNELKRIYSSLIELDPIHLKYWKYCLEQL